MRCKKFRSKRRPKPVEVIFCEKHIKKEKREGLAVKKKQDKLRQELAKKEDELKTLSLANPFRSLINASDHSLELIATDLVAYVVEWASDKLRLNDAEQTERDHAQSIVNARARQSAAENETAECINEKKRLDKFEASNGIIQQQSDAAIAQLEDGKEKLEGLESYTQSILLPSIEENNLKISQMKDELKHLRQETERAKRKKKWWQYLLFCT